MKYYDNSKTIDQATRIYEELNKDHKGVTPIVTNKGNIIATHIHNFFNPLQLLGSVKLAKIHDAKYKVNESVIIQGAIVFPHKFQAVMDLCARLVTGLEDSISFGGSAGSRLDSDFYNKSGNQFGPHVDFPGDTSHKLTEMRGLNFHYTRWGRSIVCLGLGDGSNLDTQYGANAALQYQDSRSKYQFNQRTRNLATESCASFILNPGDLLIFQAADQAKFELSGILHEFEGIGNNHRHVAIFNPAATNNSLASNLQLNKREECYDYIGFRY